MGGNRLVWRIQLCIPFIVCVSATLTASECPVEFGNKCSCGLEMSSSDSLRFTYVVDCTDSGFDNALMLRKLPPNTEKLIFTGNDIRDLPLNIFSQDVSYDRLHTIDFSNNNIQTIKGRTFHNVANVTKLILNDNDLYIVSKDHHPRMFSNFVNLKELHLRNAFTEKVRAVDYLNNLVEIFENSSLKHLRILNMEDNEISRVYENEFCSLPSLEELYLADNHLKDIPLNLSCLHNLKVLDVGNNAIPYLSSTSIIRLKENRNLKLNLTHNPFRCDCIMLDTYEWMRLTPANLINKNSFYCYDGYPNNIGRTVLSLEAENFLCVTHFDATEYHSSVPYYLLVIGGVFLCIFIIAFMVKHRSSLLVQAQRVVQPIRSKFQYISLERRFSTMDV